MNKGFQLIFQLFTFLLKAITYDWMVDCLPDLLCEKIIFVPPPRDWHYTSKPF